MKRPLFRRLGRLGLAFLVAFSLLAVCFGIVSFAAQPPSVDPDLWGLRDPKGLNSSQAAPAVDFVGGTLSPVKATQGAPVSFTVNVVNTGGLTVTLNTSTALEFSGGAGRWFTAARAAATGVPTSTAPNYVQIPLAFSRAAFPMGFAAGRYRPTLYLSGSDAGSQPYSATITSSGNSVQVVDYVTPTLPIAMATGSLDPADVIRGEPVQRDALLHAGRGRRDADR